MVFSSSDFDHGTTVGEVRIDYLKAVDHAREIQEKIAAGEINAVCKTEEEKKARWGVAGFFPIEDAPTLENAQVQVWVKFIPYGDAESTYDEEGNFKGKKGEGHEEEKKGSDVTSGKVSIKLFSGENLLPNEERKYCVQAHFQVGTHKERSTERVGLDSVDWNQTFSLPMSMHGSVKNPLKVELYEVGSREVLAQTFVKLSDPDSLGV